MTDILSKPAFEALSAVRFGFDRLHGFRNSQLIAGDCRALAMNKQNKKHLRQKEEQMKRLVSLSVSTLSFVVMTMWLAGCSSLDHADRNGPIPQGKSIVFGSISVGSPVQTGLGIAKATVINTRNSKTVLKHPVKGHGGPFYWSLPPGQYAILDLEEMHAFWNDWHSSSHRIYAEFSIDSEQTVVYVGTLDLASSSPSVTDDYDTAVKALHNQFAALTTKPIKQLLHLEKQK